MTLFIFMLLFCLTTKTYLSPQLLLYLIIIIMYIYHVLINPLSAHMIHINLNMIFYTHVEHSPTKTIYMKYYTEKQTHTLHTHTMTVAETGYLGTDISGDENTVRRGRFSVWL